jgi:hypothetical protein
LTGCRGPFAELQKGARIAWRGEVAVDECYVHEVTYVGRKSDGNWLVTSIRADGTRSTWASAYPDQKVTLAPEGSALGWRALTEDDIPARPWASVRTRSTGDA